MLKFDITINLTVLGFDRLSTVPTFSYFFLLFLLFCFDPTFSYFFFKSSYYSYFFHKKVMKKSLCVLIKWSKIEIYINNSYL